MYIKTKYVLLCFITCLLIGIYAPEHIGTAIVMMEELQNAAHDM